MTAYVDSSVLLRIVLSQPGALPEWLAIQQMVTSALTEVECLRTLDRRHQLGQLDLKALAERRNFTFELLRHAHLADVTATILRRAADPFPAPLGTLDAIHLATALLLRDAGNEALVFATHDRPLAIAAQASGFRTIGL